MATVVIVPGSFSPASNYDTLSETFKRHGITSVVVTLQSVGRREDGRRPGTMSDDADEIVRVVDPLLAEGKKVVLFTHSYGGLPGTQSLERLSQKARAAKGQQGGIETVIYLTSIVLPPGLSNMEASVGAKAPDFLHVEDDYMTVDPVGNAPMTFSDLPPEEALLHAKTLINHSTASFQEKLTYPGYNDVDVHYIFCEKDKIIPPEAQNGMIQMMNGLSGREVQVHKLDCDHAPTVGRTEDLAEITKKVLQGS